MAEQLAAISELGTSRRLRMRVGLIWLAGSRRHIACRDADLITNRIFVEQIVERRRMLKIGVSSAYRLTLPS